MSDDQTPLGDKYVGLGAALLFAAFMLSPLVAAVPPSLLIQIAASGAGALLWLWRIWAFGRLLGWISIIIGGLSGLSAVYLMSIAIQGVQRDLEANERRCLAIQRDMLSQKPQRSDGPDLFQALGCKPRGEGSVYTPKQSP